LTAKVFFTEKGYPHLYSLPAQDVAQGEKNGRKRSGGLLIPYGKHRNWAQAPWFPDKSHIPTGPPSFFICKYACVCVYTEPRRR